MKCARWIGLTMIAAVISFGVFGGCSSVGQERGGDAEALDEEMRGFHSDLRWARYDHARNTVHDAYRPTFDGKFEERGDDYEIVDMEMKRVDLVEEGFAAVVEVEQQWYQLPSTMVEKERFVERWVYEDGRWWMRERMERSEYRDRGEVFDSEPDDEPAVGEGEEEAGVEDPAQ